MDKYLKCDLHLHSSSCYSRKYTREDFIERMKTVDLDVFSITDHNVIDVLLYKELARDLGDSKSILGGVELNLSIDQDTIDKHNLVVKGNYFHAVVWFSLEDLDIFWNQLETLIIELGIDVKKKSIKEISKATEGKCFLLSKLQYYLKDIDYYLTFHEGKSARCLSEYLPNNDKETNENIKSNQVYKHNLFYYNNKLAIEGGRKTKNVSSFFEDNLNTLVTRFFFSDALKLEDIGKKFTWINFDGKFESLMLPLSDPNARVFTSDNNDNNPQVNRNQYLEKIKLFMLDPKTEVETEVELEFSPSYNGIIGSRGSGKTLLGSVLSNKDISNYVKFIDHSKTEYKIFGKSYQNNSPRSKYLAQNSLLNLFRNGEAKNIEFIKDFYKKLEIQKKKLTSTFTNKTKILFEYEKQEFLNLHHMYQSAIKDITFLEDSVNEDYMIPMIEKESFQNGEKLIDNFAAKVVEINQINETLRTKIIEINTSPEEYSELGSFNQIITDFKKGVINSIDLINEKIAETQEKVAKYDRKLVKLREKFISYYLESLINTNNLTDKPSQTQLEDKAFALEQLKEFTKFRAKTQKIYDLISLWLNEVKQETKSDDIEINKTDKLAISTTIEDLKEYRFHIGEELKNYEENMHNEIIFNLLLKFNDITKLRELFQGNKYKQKSLSSVNEYLEKLYSNLLASIQEFDKFTIKLYFNDKDLEEYSPGKKSEILLDIFLDKSLLDEKYLYIVLDQPEDNMDTKTITQNLIRRLRELKRDIQIFVISHSAAVIINGDAEHLIYAYEKGLTLDYEQGRIIDKKMKKNIVDTLDGGEKNLKMRFNKYDFKMEGK